MSEALSRSKKVNNVMILTATSGDTGKAALEGFKDVDGTNIVVFYPEDGVSSMQKLQMLTQEGKNTWFVQYAVILMTLKRALKSSLRIRSLTMP